jgi:Photoprotection regulator fluorescence recovery protein
MTSLTPRQGQFGTTMREMKWSPTEKVIARKAFDLALGRELQSVTLEARSKAAKIQEPSDLWDLEQYLTQRRQEIDRTFDYRYSLLPLVFANFLRSGRLVEEDLRGLGEDKLACIHRASVHL